MFISNGFDAIIFAFLIHCGRKPPVAKGKTAGPMHSAKA